MSPRCELSKCTVLALILFTLSGCTILQHRDQLATLGGYARDKGNQDKIVKLTNAHYDALLKAIANDSIKRYHHKRGFVRAFGLPILKKDLADGSQQWLYRYAILRTAKTKVYVYFDRQDQLVKWEKVLCPSLF